MSMNALANDKNMMNWREIRPRCPACGEVIRIGVRHLCNRKTQGELRPGILDCFSIPKGWLCPRCNRVNAPHVDHCPCDSCPE